MLLGSLAGYVTITAIFLISLTIHEYAHARVAYHYGDDTAARMGRLTLNPLAHISLFGTILLPLIIRFGWAKPVPVDFSVLTRRQIFRVAAAGPAANLLLALGLALVFHALRLPPSSLLGSLVLVAIPANIALATFNLLPIPPLDGSRMVYAKLRSPQSIAMYHRVSQFGLLILIVFLYSGGFERFVLPAVGVLYVLLGLPF